MKKSTKPAKSPAPATKSAAAKSAQSAKPASARSTAKRAPAAKPAAKPQAKAPRRASSAAVVPVPAPTVSPAVVTTITALIDIGFGNTLHIRGEGAGLSWDRGLPMECVTDNQWRITLGESGRHLAFKFLVNDLSWSAGADFVIEAGSSVTLEPTF